MFFSPPAACLFSASPPTHFRFFSSSSTNLVFAERSLFATLFYFFFCLYATPLSFAMKTTSFFVPILAAACVSAHGFLSKVTINGKAYNGNIPSGASNPSPIRQVTSQDPNKLPSSSVICGPGAKVASQVASANPGDTIQFDWKTASLGNVRLFLLFLCSAS